MRSAFAPPCVIGAAVLSITIPAHAAVQVDDIEVTQAIQDMHGSVVLVAEKLTWVRVYVSDSTLTDSLTGSLQVKNAATAATVTVKSDNVLQASYNEPLLGRRKIWPKSLNFRLPVASTSAGSYEISVASVEDARTGAALDCGSCGGTVNADFKDTPPLRIHLVGLEYRGGDPLQSQAPRDVDFDAVESWLGRAYPVSRLIVSTETVPARSVYKPSCNQANTQLAALRSSNVSLGEDRRTHYLGLVYNGGSSCPPSDDPAKSCFMRGCSSVPTYPNPAAIASTPVGPTNGVYIPINDKGDKSSSFGSWYGGHELSHSFGRLHPGYCNGNSTDDRDWPKDHVVVIKDDSGNDILAGSISNKAGDAVGLDVGDSRRGIPLLVLPGETTLDVMTYCDQPQWLSDYTYNGIQARLVAENSFGGAPAMAEAEATAALVGDPDQVVTGSFVHIVASVDVTNQAGKIEYISPATSASPQSRDAKTAELVTLRADGSVIAQYPVDLLLDSDTVPNEPQRGLVDASVRMTPDLREIRLLLNGNQVDSFQASQQKPSKPFSLASRLGGGHLAAGTTGMLLSWNEKASREPVTYTIEVSDDKKVWTTVAVGARSPSVELSNGQRKHKFVRVFATNGFKNSDPVTMELGKLQRRP